METLLESCPGVAAPRTLWSSGDTSGPEYAVLELYQGTDFAGIVDVTYDDGTPVNLTGYKARAQIRRDVADRASEVIAEITVAIVVPSQISLSLAAVITQTMYGSYVWDLKLTAPNGKVDVLLAGPVFAGQEVTRPSTPVLVLR